VSAANLGFCQMIRPHRPGIAIKKLLVPTDFSEYSRFALRYAVALAKSFEAKVYVIHVHEPYPQGSALEGIYYDPEIMEEDALDAIVKELRVQKIDAQAVFVKGRPFMGIIRLGPTTRGRSDCDGHARTQRGWPSCFWLHGRKGSADGALPGVDGETS
jgi:hypothetical protein